MYKSKVHFVNGVTLDLTYKRVKHNEKNGAMVFSLADNKTLTLNWNNVLYIEDAS